MKMKMRLLWVIGASLAAALPLNAGSAASDSAGTTDKATAGTPAAPPTSPIEKAEVGKKAPEFELKDLDGKSVLLSSYKGKVVVLEWFNPDCPFVKYAHNRGALREMAAKYTAKGVVWLAINSSAVGKEGYGVETNRRGRDGFKLQHPILLDETGKVGRMYEAHSTPHLYVIDKSGVLRYRGALDNAPLGEVEGGIGYENYAEKAIESILANKQVDTKETRSYGCSVKYGN